MRPYASSLEAWGFYMHTEHYVDGKLDQDFVIHRSVAEFVSFESFSKQQTYAWRPALPGGAPLAVHSLLRLPFGRDQISSNSPPSISKRFARIGAGRDGSSSLTER